MFGSSPHHGVTYSNNAYYGGGSVASSGGYPFGSFSGASMPAYGSPSAYGPPPQGSSYGNGSVFSNHSAIGYADSYPNMYPGSGSYVAPGANYAMGPPPDQQLNGMQTAESMIAYPGYFSQQRGSPQLQNNESMIAYGTTAQRSAVDGGRPIKMYKSRRKKTCCYCI
mmetsp:Transcript_121673/g.190897  ORF Transcript_121673/g.190897 Transcript_121673/m.190897 type:complete len:167 (+) Transcript_121673:51-551(+)